MEHQARAVRCADRRTTRFRARRPRRSDSTFCRRLRSRSARHLSSRDLRHRPTCDPLWRAPRARHSSFSATGWRACSGRPARVWPTCSPTCERWIALAVRPCAVLARGAREHGGALPRGRARRCGRRRTCPHGPARRRSPARAGGYRQRGSVDAAREFEAAAKALLGEDVVVVPEFVIAHQAGELINALAASRSGALFDHLVHPVDKRPAIDSPVDSWLTATPRPERLRAWEQHDLAACPAAPSRRSMRCNCRTYQATGGSDSTFRRTGRSKAMGRCTPDILPPRSSGAAPVRSAPR